MVQQIEISHDLENLHIYRQINYLTYGAVDKTDEFDPFAVRDCSLYFEEYTALNDAYNSNNILDSTFRTPSDVMIEKYEDHREEFIKQAESGESFGDYSFSQGAQFYRADSQVMSFWLMDLEIGGDSDNDVATCVNICPAKQNEMIHFDDVVRDPEALKAYVRELFTGDKAYMADMIEVDIDEKTDFCMVYDGIIMEGVKIPVIGHEEIFNMEWFGATPQDYSLILDSENKLAWDFDRDGSIEELACEFDYDTSTLKITLGSETFEFTSSEIEMLGVVGGIDWYQESVVMTTSDGSFLFLVMSQDEYSRTFLFDINGGKVTYIEDMMGFPLRTLDPKDFDFCDYMSFFGGESMFRPSMLGADGKIVGQTPSFYCYSIPYMVYNDIKGKEFDWNTGELIGDYTIKGETFVSIVAYSPFNGSLVLMPLDKDMTLENQKYIMIETDSDAGTIAGKLYTDVFGGQFYSGGVYGS